MIGIILSAIPAEVWAALGGIVAIVAAWITGRRSGATDAQRDAATDAARKYTRTAKRMQDAGSDGVSDDDVREWLRKRGK